jgi:protein-tyrosine phosphatase
VTEKKRICFVCMGNIVRSPLAEALFIHLAGQDGLGDRFSAASAGVIDYHVGEPPDARVLRAAARHGFQYEHRARQFLRSDFDRYDLIFAMDGENKSALLAQARTPEERVKIHLLREFDPLGGPNAPVPDPYYGGKDGFEEVYQMVERSVRGLLESLKT